MAVLDVQEKETVRGFGKSRKEYTHPKLHRRSEAEVKRMPLCLQYASCTRGRVLMEAGSQYDVEGPR